MSHKIMEQKTGKTEMSFLEHLEVLRWHLIRSAVVIIAFMILAFIYKEFLFDTVLFAAKDPSFITYRLLCRFSRALNLGEGACVSEIPFTIINISMAGQFMTHMTISAVAGLILAFPYVFWELWRFVSPALYPAERKYTRSIVLSASLLFIAGVLFGYFILAPMSILFLGTYEVSSSVVNQINLNSYISTLSSMTLISGIVFELPMLSYILAKLGIITAGFMRKYRRHSIVAVFIVAGIITPPDVVSQVLTAAPLLFLYEASIWVVAVTEKKKKN